MRRGVGNGRFVGHRGEVAEPGTARVPRRRVGGQPDRQPGLARTTGAG